jgi:hypothetical protein
MNKSSAVMFLASLFFGAGASAQGFVANYEESKVPEYQLPDPLVTEAGKPVTDAETWLEVRRPEIFDLFQKHVFGRSPEPVPIHHQVVSTTEDALGGKAIRREIDITIGQTPDAVTMRMLLYTPKIDGPAPAFLGLNFAGNHTVEPDPTISITTNWVRDKKDGSTGGHRATEAGRGISAKSWPAEMIIDRGYALATIYYGDIDPDFHDGFKNGIHASFQDWAADVPEQERWGSIAGWAYGLSRALDYLQEDPLVDGSRVAVIGHSRLGKTSLWAGASDPRFKVVISNNSGCGGAALSRRAFGETVGRINSSFPHWFSRRHRDYNDNESALPVDHHQLIALIAPRPVYIASATEDQWADPKGEFLSAVHADPVYRLLDDQTRGAAPPPEEMPPADQPVSWGAIGYHLRTGAHAVTEYDWSQFLDFADRHL